ncbi:MAG: TrbI/VirB10 family protein [Candidatus Melainabacteria bacterium]|nr:MAG: TrbI/VirB10 family protein [Candidatus Melainabacteria bacterium]
MLSPLCRPKNLILAAVLTSQLATGAILPAMADTAVRIAGAPAFSVSSGAGGQTATQRTATMQRNLDNALVASTDRSPNSVKVTYVNGQPVLTLGGFYIATPDAASAKKQGLTTAALANKWAAGLKASLKNSGSVNRYIASLTGGDKPSVGEAGTTTTSSGSFPYYKQGRIAYIPAGMMMPVTVNTALSSGVSRVGDKVEASLAQPINLGNSEIPAGSLLIGQVTTAVPGARMSHSGNLGLKFTRLRTPDGVETPITAHIVGDLGKFHLASGAQSDVFRGETTKQKIEKAAIHGAIGAGSGAVIGTVIGAIAGGGRGAGRGAIAGLGLGTGIGVAESLLLRKGDNVNVGSGDAFNLQLDAPASVAISSSAM